MNVNTMAAYRKCLVSNATDLRNDTVLEAKQCNT